MEPVDCEDEIHLPPLAHTPRFLTAQAETNVTSQPTHLQTPRSVRKVSPEIVCCTGSTTPRRSLKQVSLGRRKWTTNLCDCMDDSSACFFSCISPCYIKWSIAKYLGENRCAACIPGSGIVMRTKVRTIGSIQGSILGDICVICCCPCLGISQMTRELDQMIVQPELYGKPVQE